MVRAPCCAKIGLRQGTWTPEEDQSLKSYIEKHGHGNWRALPSKAGLLRCGKSCRLRWMNYLRPDIKRGNYSKEEQETIVSLHQSLGNRWSSIAAKLPGRTDNEIKNYWHTYLKKHLNEYALEPKTKQRRQDNVKEQQKLKLKIPNQEITDEACADDNFFSGEKVDTTTRQVCSQSSSSCKPVDFCKNLAPESSTLDGYDVTEDFLGTVVDPEEDFWVTCFQKDREQTEIPNDTKEFWFSLLMETRKSLEI